MKAQLGTITQHSVLDTAPFPASAVVVGTETSHNSVASSADPVTFTNSASVTLGASQGTPAKATPYPTEIDVSGVETVSSVTVRLNGFGHAFPSDVDILLVAPSGTNVIIMSDVGNGEAVEGVDLTLTDSAAMEMPLLEPLTSGTYKPTNLDGEDSDVFPMPAPTPLGGSALATFVGEPGNGTWQLYVTDDELADSGVIAGGWELEINGSAFGNSASVAIADATIATGMPYPSEIEVTGLSGTISKVSVELNLLQHECPEDLDMMIVGPTGARTLLLSDVGGCSAVTEVTVLLSDDAASSITSPISSGTFKPSNSGTNDYFPVPSPPATTNLALSVFDGTSPNGAWKLFMVDDFSLIDTGALNGGWTLILEVSTSTGVTKKRFQLVSE